MNTDSTKPDNSISITFDRVWIFLAVIASVFLFFGFRLFSLQIIQGEDYDIQSDENRRSDISIPTLRGVIYDRNGIVLAKNVASYNIAITPAYLPDDQGEQMKIFRELSEITSVPVNKGDLDEALIICGDNLGIQEMAIIGESFAPYSPVLIKCDVPREIAMYITERAIELPGVSIEIDPIREYPTGKFTAGIVGFLGPIPAALEAELRELGFIPGRDKVGYAGIELEYQDILNGSAGKQVVEVDVGGQVIRDLEPPINPEPGNNVVLTIDYRLQQAAYNILENEIDLWNSYLREIRMTSGAVIAINVKTGEILALVSWPTYENNRLARFIPTYYYEQLVRDSTQPLFNHAVGAELPVGSVFKLVTATGALNEGVITADQIIDAPPEIVIENSYYPNDPGQTKTFVDWNKAGFGSINFVNGLANSSNVYFYKLGGGYKDEVPEGLGVCRLGTYSRALGYGDVLGLQLPEANAGDGLIPDPTWKRINQGENWSTGDTYLAAVGQGYVLATPLHVLMSAAVIANDGVFMQPTLIREIQDGEGKIIQTFEPQPLYDLTIDPMIEQYENPDGIGSCKVIVDDDGAPILTTIDPYVFDKVQEGMRKAVTHGTLKEVFDLVNVTVAAAGKTGTAEYCDDIANNLGRCVPGNWPTHAWTVSYAPFDDPEIAVVAFVYNGGEGASVAGPIVGRVINAYFQIKAIDQGIQSP